MPDWTQSMQRTFEYYIVDPVSWRDVQRIDTVISSSISWDASAETLGSASFEMTEPIGEKYIRIYLITLQNGVRERRSLGPFLAQTPSSTFNGLHKSISVDAYTPLIELKEKQPPIGYTVQKGQVIMNRVYTSMRDNMRAPVIRATAPNALENNFTANLNDSWMTFVLDLIKLADYRIDLDELCRVIFSPVQIAAYMQPVWTFNDDNSSILSPDITMDQDLYGIPNVIEVIYRYNDGTQYIARAENDDSLSPISTVTRGREIVQRITDAKFNGTPTHAQVDKYSIEVLKKVSTISYKVSYSHAYCPVRVNDCVRINYTRAGLNNVLAKVTSQSISCTPDMPVSETAVYTMKLWR